MTRFALWLLYFLIFQAPVIGAGADESYLDPAFYWDSQKNERSLSEVEKGRLDVWLKGDLKSAMNRVTKIYRDQRAQEDDQMALAPNCFWWSFAWHIEELRRTPRPVEFIIDASFLGESPKAQVDLRGYSAASWTWNDNSYYGIAETLRLNQDWLSREFEEVPEESARSGDIYFVFNVQKGFNNYPVDYEDFLATKFEFPPYRFFSVARHVVHAGLYVGDGFVFQKDAIVTEAFHLMTVTDAKVLWQKAYSKGWGQGEGRIVVSDFEIKLLRPKPSFVGKLREILQGPK